jgi:hypothetical protein
MKSEKQIFTEAEVRQLRDNVYGTPSTDANWNHAKLFVDSKSGYNGGWMRAENIHWLIQNQPRP